MIDQSTKYEERLQGSSAFAMATLLDPQLKLNYIPACDHENLKADICKALQEVQDEGNQAILHNIETIESDLVSSYILKGNGNKILSRVGRMTKPAAMRPISYIHELHAYLQQATVEEDALTWWKASGYRAYPKIAILAKNSLSICATSASTERFFSSGWGIITCTRSRLNAESISTLMTLKCWLQQARFEDNKFVDNDDELDTINDEAFESVGGDYDES